MLDSSKICSKCNKEKNSLEFNKNQAWCRSCEKQWRLENKDKKKEYDKIRREENKEELKEYHKEYVLNNHEELQEYRHNYYQENKDEILSYQKEYYENNKEKVLERNKKYTIDNHENLSKKKYLYKKNRLNEDINFKLREKVSNSIRNFLKKNGKPKKGSINNFLPFKIEELKPHIEKQFESWMNWNNWGVYNPNAWDDDNSLTWKWNIDHIIPQSKLPYSSMKDENFKKCWSLENLRPYSAKKNILEGDKRNFAKDSAVPENYLNKIICGDALTVMQGMPDECIDLIVMSPPYNLNIRKTFGNTQNWAGKWNNSKLQVVGYDSHDDSMPEEEYILWQQNVLKESYRLLKHDGAIFYNCKWRVQEGIYEQRLEIIEGLPLRQIIIWAKSGGINFSPGYYLPTYEPIYLIAKADFKIANKAQKYGDVWKITQEKNSWHPAPFPLEIASRCVESVKEGSTILDPFMGSGTVAVACKKQNKNYIGIDISETYCKKAQERLDSI